MIRIILLGRTGNHLFQYALGRVLAEKHGVPLVLDASWFNAQGWAEVSHFLKLPLKAKVVRRFPLAMRALRKLSGRHYWEFRTLPFLREPETDQSFSPRFLAAPANCVLFGYFQTPGYFETLAGELRSEFKALLASTEAWASRPPSLQLQLTQPTAVAVHVRRGDYLLHPALQVCGESYYFRAMDRMRSLVPGARFLVFSDDPAWCHETFTAADTVVVDAGRPSPLIDLHLMSLASHHIIANSTYSWWAAWIGKTPGQQVIMPGRWYADDSITAPIDEKRQPGWTIITADKSHS
jgi:Glycosyl transferase family 11